ncbi:MAG: hypothetical protein G8345_00640 [Magnetococcales bacterium]|nr:hypothetical protein [Magnetococcales bacterium]
MEAITPSIELVEKSINRVVVVDKKVLEECFIQTFKTIKSLQVIDGVNDPSCVKTGGSLAYWIVKLKPFRVFCFSEFQSLCEEMLVGDYNIIPDLQDSCEINDQPKNNYINEIIALIVGSAIANNKSKQMIKFHSRKVFHDLVVGLRYRIISSHTFIMILEAASHPVDP